jgi:hypothetical protein
LKVAALGLWRNNKKMRSETMRGSAFKELGFTFEFPSTILEDIECIFRVMKTSFDHYSHRCRSLCLRGFAETIPNLGSLLQTLGFSNLEQ